MSSDNRTQLQDCEASADFSTTGAQLGATNEAGLVFEGTNSIDVQHNNVFDDTYADQDSASATFSLDLSDSTIYIVIKDNVSNNFAALGTTLVVGDGTDRIGYSAGGNDAVGIPLALQFWCFKLDVSEPVTTPGTVDVDYHEYAGTEANLAQTTVTQVGVGTLHLAKASGTVSNLWIDGIYYIANGSYALTINAGTVGTPETMADVVSDDITSGWGITSNPLGSQYIFFAPTEWGESSANADHYFTASDEQWYWMGDNSGGRSIGATHFPFRVIGNATDTGSFVLSGIAIVNTGVGAEFDCESTDVDTLEIDGGSMTGLASFNAPSSGGTSRFCTNVIFSACGQITHNGADMSGCSVLISTAAAGSGGILYNETADPDGEMDNMTFSQGAASHSAIEFGTLVTTDVTLRNIDFTGFGSTDDVNGAVFKFLKTTGSLNLNLIGCTTDGTFSVDDSAGIAVTVVINPVTESVNVKDTSDPAVNIENARVLIETAEIDASGEIFEAAVTTLTQSAGTATCTTTAVHGLATNDKVVIRGAQADGYNKVATVTVSSTTIFTYAVDSGLGTPATGTPVVSFVALHGLTDVSGDISASRTWTSAQAMKGWVRKKNTSSPFYKQGAVAYDIDIINGNATNVALQPDE